MKVRTCGIVDDFTLEFARLSDDEARTLQAVIDAIWYCNDYEFATVAGAAGLMREQRQNELMSSPYSCSRDDDERHDEWGALHLARHLELFVATDPLVREFEAAVAELLQLMRAGNYDTVTEMIDGINLQHDNLINYTMETTLRLNVELRAALERLGDYAERFSLDELWETGVVIPILTAASSLAETVRYNDPPDDRPTPCPCCGKDL